MYFQGINPICWTPASLLTDSFQNRGSNHPAFLFTLAPSLAAASIPTAFTQSLVQLTLLLGLSREQWIVVNPHLRPCKNSPLEIAISVINSQDSLEEVYPFQPLKALKVLCEFFSDKKTTPWTQDWLFDWERCFCPSFFSIGQERPVFSLQDEEIIELLHFLTLIPPKSVLHVQLSCLLAIHFPQQVFKKGLLTHEFIKTFFNLPTFIPLCPSAFEQQVLTNNIERAYRCCPFIWLQKGELTIPASLSYFYFLLAEHPFGALDILTLESQGWPPHQTILAFAALPVVCLRSIETWRHLDPCRFLDHLDPCRFLEKADLPIEGLDAAIFQLIDKAIACKLGSCASSLLKMAVRIRAIPHPKPCLIFNVADLLEKDEACDFLIRLLPLPFIPENENQEKTLLFICQPLIEGDHPFLKAKAVKLFKMVEWKKASHPFKTSCSILKNRLKKENRLLSAGSREEQLTQLSDILSDHLKPHSHILYQYIRLLKHCKPQDYPLFTSLMLAFLEKLQQEPCSDTSHALLDACLQTVNQRPFLFGIKAIRIALLTQAAKRTGLPKKTVERLVLLTTKSNPLSSKELALCFHLIRGKKLSGEQVVRLHPIFLGSCRDQKELLFQYLSLLQTAKIHFQIDDELKVQLCFALDNPTLNEEEFSFFEPLLKAEENKELHILLCLASFRLKMEKKAKHWLNIISSSYYKSAWDRETTEKLLELMDRIPSLIPLVFKVLGRQARPERLNLKQERLMLFKNVVQNEEQEGKKELLTSYAEVCKTDVLCSETAAFLCENESERWSLKEWVFFLEHYEIQKLSVWQKACSTCTPTQEKSLQKKLCLLFLSSNNPDLLEDPLLCQHFVKEIPNLERGMILKALKNRSFLTTLEQKPDLFNQKQWVKLLEAMLPDLKSQDLGNEIRVFFCFKDQLLATINEKLRNVIDQELALQILDRLLPFFDTPSLLEPICFYLYLISEKALFKKPLHTYIKTAAIAASTYFLNNDMIEAFQLLHTLSRYAREDKAGINHLEIVEKLVLHADVESFCRLAVAYYCTALASLSKKTPQLKQLKERIKSLFTCLVTKPFPLCHCFLEDSLKIVPLSSLLSSEELRAIRKEKSRQASNYLTRFMADNQTKETAEILIFFKGILAFSYAILEPELEDETALLLQLLEAGSTVFSSSEPLALFTLLLNLFDCIDHSRDEAAFIRLTEQLFMRLLDLFPAERWDECLVKVTTGVLTLLIRKDKSLHPLFRTLFERMIFHFPLHPFLGAPYLEAYCPLFKQAVAFGVYQDKSASPQSLLHAFHFTRECFVDYLLINGQSAFTHSLPLLCQFKDTNATLYLEKWLHAIGKGPFNEERKTFAMMLDHLLIEVQEIQAPDNLTAATVFLNIFLSHRCKRALNKQLFIAYIQKIAETPILSDALILPCQEGFIIDRIMKTGSYFWLLLEWAVDFLPYNEASPQEWDTLLMPLLSHYVKQLKQQAGDYWKEEMIKAMLSANFCNKCISWVHHHSVSIP